MIPWREKINMLSINPDAADRDDVANLAAELSELEDTMNYIIRLGKEKTCTKEMILMTVEETMKLIVDHRKCEEG